MKRTGKHRSKRRRIKFAKQLCVLFHQQFSLSLFAKSSRHIFQLLLQIRWTYLWQDNKSIERTSTLWVLHRKMETHTFRYHLVWSIGCDIHVQSNTCNACSVRDDRITIMSDVCHSGKSGCNGKDLIKRLRLNFKHNESHKVKSIVCVCFIIWIFVFCASIWEHPHKNPSEFSNVFTNKKSYKK